MAKGNIGRVVIYVRVSTDEQADNYSIESQIAACQRYAEQQGWIVVAVLQDVMSGTRLDRPGLTHARDLIQQKAVDVLLAYSSDRLTRSLAHSLLIRDELKSAGVELHCVTKGISPDTPEGYLFDNIGAAFDEYERLRIAERLTRGKRGKATSGKIVGHGAEAPYGYRWQGEKRDKHLVIVEEEAAIIRMIVQWYLEGTPILHIKDKLSELRIPTPGDTRRTPTGKIRGYGQWNSSGVYCILRSSTYAGVYKTGQGNYAYKKTKTPPSQYIDVPVPPVLDMTTWEAIQAKLDAGSKYGPRNRKRFYLLSGHIRCQCGYAVGGRTNVQKRLTIEDRTYSYYFCLGHHTDALRPCSLPSFPQSAVEYTVWTWIDQEVLNEAHIQEAVADREDTSEQERARLQAEQTRYYRVLSELEGEYNQYTILFGKKRISFEKYEEMISPVEKAQASTKQELEKIEQQLKGLTITQDNAERLCALVRQIRANLDRGVTDETKRFIIELLDTHVTLLVEDDEKYLDVVCYLTLDEVRLKLVEPGMPVSFVSTSSAAGKGCTARRDPASRARAARPPGMPHRRRAESRQTAASSPGRPRGRRSRRRDRSVRARRPARQ